MNSQHWIFLSPHFDDVVLSCGGLVWELTQQGSRVEIWTILSGYPFDENFSEFARQNHQLWGKAGREAIDTRRTEDTDACQLLGAQPKYFDWPDVIYRKHEVTGKPIVNSNDELFNAPPEPPLIEEIADKLSELIPPKSALVLPMGLGGHLDHRVVVAVGEKMARADYYYADYPYILRDFDSPLLTESVYKKLPRNLTKDALQAWRDAVLCYSSQLSTFWRDDEETRLALRNYFAGDGGRLWIKA